MRRLYLNLGARLLRLRVFKIPIMALAILLYAFILLKYLSIFLSWGAGKFMAENNNILNGNTLIVNYTMDGIDLHNCSENSATVQTNLFIPIFVMTRDRVTSLRKSLESYKRTFISPFEIVILDHNSTFPPMVEY